MKPSHLDAALEKARKAASHLSTVFEFEALALKRSYKQEGCPYTLEELSRIAERHAKTTQILIDAAPFFQVKQQIEITEHLKEALMDSTEFIGETRENMLKFLMWYQEEVLKKTGHYQPKDNQYQLI